MYEEVPHQGFEPRAVVKEFHIPGKEQDLLPGVMHKTTGKNTGKPRGPSPWFFAPPTQLKVAVV